MSTITMQPAVAPSFGMPVSGHASLVAPCAGAWLKDAATINPAFVGAAARTHVLTEGDVAFDGKRRTTKGSPAWRPTDC